MSTGGTVTAGWITLEAKRVFSACGLRCAAALASCVGAVVSFVSSGASAPPEPKAVDVSASFCPPPEKAQPLPRQTLPLICT